MHIVRSGLASRMKHEFIRTATCTAKHRAYPTKPSWRYLASRHYSEAPQVNAKDRENSSDTSAEAPPPSTESLHDQLASLSQQDKEIKAKLVAKEAEVIDLTARLRYSQADYQNLQRIAAKEKEQTRDYAITRFATDLLETLDVLSLALQSIPSSYASSPPAPAVNESLDHQGEPLQTPSERSPTALLHELYNGVDLTHKQLLSTLAKHGMTPFNPIHQKFDPNLHEALYAISMEGKESGTVIETQKPGYMLKGRVLRAAQVGIVQES